MTGSRNPNRSRESDISGRAIGALVLCFLLPPVGLIYMWRALVFPLRGRVVMTLFATAELMLLFAWGMFGFISWNSLPDTVAPVPGVPVAVTRAPEEQTLNALSNIRELLSQDDGSGSAATPEPNATDEAAHAAELARQQEIYETIVYSVNRGAKFYHVAPVCGDQRNNRQLTVREALAAQLGACPNCNPPAP